MAVLALQQLTTYLGSRDLADLAGYRVTRASIAAEVGRRLLIDADRLDAAWAATDYVHQTALLAAFTQLGTPYRRNTSKPGVGFDCSGLTTYAWGVAGVRLTRQSSAQINAAVPRTLESAEAGDLVQYPGHVMMYLGLDKAIVHAIQPGRPVEVDYISKRRELRFGHPA